jgi:hypothetical protein
MTENTEGGTIPNDQEESSETVEPDRSGRAIYFQ